mmetsp:Transcript_19983/g.55628  ORF Transcript_19983/g.55628 Transcript_19983/m.55628 type:complete len:480 (+) Transcript_19983:87-1526(+)
MLKPCSCILQPARRICNQSVSKLCRDSRKGLVAVAGRQPEHALSALSSPTLECPNTLQQQPTSAYLHLPFCKRKCFYCDFPVEAVGMKTEAQRVQQRMQDYVELLCKEIKAMQPLNDAPLKTVYFGGGTPSLVPPDLMARILDTLHYHLRIEAQAEITLEADPGTFDAPRLRAYMDLGINRISMGVQSFDEGLLKACGRPHDLKEVYRAIEAVHASGIPSWSLDIISGLPRLSMGSWQHTLQEAVRAQPSHVSVYDLQVEEGTPFARWYSPGSAPLPEDDDTASMYTAASSTLQNAGYEHYEVSNYARHGHRSQHNQVYWHGLPCYGFGLGAASYVEGRRFSRPASMPKYKQWVEEFASPGSKSRGVPALSQPPDSQEERMLDTVMLRLRTADGLDMRSFAAEYGADAASRVLAAMESHFQDGLVLAIHEGREPAGPTHPGSMQEQLRSARGVRLADPDGFLLSNHVISDVFAALSALG